MKNVVCRMRSLGLTILINFKSTTIYIMQEESKLGAPRRMRKCERKCLCEGGNTEWHVHGMRC